MSKSKNRPNLFAKRSQPRRCLQIESLEDRRVMAYDLQLVKDINTTSHTYHAMPTNETLDTSFANVNGVLYYPLNSPLTGIELWRTDGTDNGTYLVKDINPGGQKYSDVHPGPTRDSYPSLLTNVNGTLFFVADDGTHGRELWKSDGTAAGTQLVKDIQLSSPSQPGANIKALTNVNGTLYFSADDLTHGSELWKSDGTEAGTKMVKDIATGNTASAPYDLTNLNGTLLFIANDAVHGAELWKSDGTITGTQMLADIIPGANATLLHGPFPYSNAVENVHTANGKLIISTSDAGIWGTDGTTAGTKQLHYSAAIGETSQIIDSVGDVVYFSTLVRDLNHEKSRNELWKTDGTIQGTIKIRDFSIVKRYFNSSYHPTYYTGGIGAGFNAGGTLFFTAKDDHKSDTTHNLELWKSDGSAANTLLVKDAGQFNSRDLPFPSYISADHLTSLNGLLFRATSDNLWQFNATTGDTTVVSNLGTTGNNNSGFVPITSLNNKLYFPAEGRIWKSNGSTAGTIHLADKDSYTFNDGSFPSYLTNVSNSLYFSTRFEQPSLWKSDGTAAGTQEIDALAQEVLGRKFNANGVFYNFLTDPAHATGLWKSDGTAAGTTLIKQIDPGHNGGVSITNVNGTLYFQVPNKDAIHIGYDLWKSDGTAAGTVLVKSVDSSSLIKSMGAGSGDTLFYSTPISQHTSQLWKTNGPNSTVLLKNDIPDDTYFGVDQFLTVQGITYFVANRLKNGSDLWKTDGTASGTKLVKHFDRISAFDFDSTPILSLHEFNNTLFFKVVGTLQGSGLWKTDGTTAGTELVLQHASNEAGSEAFYINDGDHFYYSVFGAVYISDGTKAGTTLLRRDKTIAFDECALFEGNLYFKAGKTYYQSNGTVAGTIPVLSFPTSGNLKDAANLTAAGGNLFLTAYSDKIGRELFRFVKVNTPATSVEHNAAGEIEIRDLLGKKDDLTISRMGSNLVINDNSTVPADGVITATGIPGVTGSGTKSLVIPMATIEATGKPLRISLSAGDDRLRINTIHSSDSIPSTGLQVDLGAGNDTFTLFNNTEYNAWTINGPQTGNVVIGKLGTVNFSNVENLAGGTGSDYFKLTNAGLNGITNINGNSGIDAIEIASDANFTLSNTGVIVATATVAQTYGLMNIEQATLTGGAGNNFINARYFTGTAILSGGDGNDILWGGSGNDTLNGGNGDDWLSGGAGNDLLLGYNGRDILVGGGGADQLNRVTSSGSDNGSDLLIGGSTKYDYNKTAIDALLATWSSSMSYTNHLVQLFTTGVGPTKQYKLNSTTVFDDQAIDILLGGSGNDWFFAGTTDKPDNNRSEQLVNV